MFDRWSVQVNPAPASGKSSSKSAAITADLMPTWKEYHLASNISDALHALAVPEGQGRVIAGGTDLLLDLQQGRQPPVHTLVDVSAIPEMNAIEIRDGELFIGAAVPLSRVVAAELVWEHACALGEACSLIGGPQVRNTATLGGNVAHALPAADGSIALLAMDAQAEVAALAGWRRLPMRELFLGPGRSALRQGQDILVGFYLPLRQAGSASAFKRVMRPQGVALPILNMAAWIHRQGAFIAGVRIALGPAGPVPFRAVDTEDFLRGEPFDPIRIAEAAESLHCEACFRTSPHRATLDYRCYLATVLLPQVLDLAWERAAHEEAVPQTQG